MSFSKVIKSGICGGNRMKARSVPSSSDSKNHLALVVCFEFQRKTCQGKGKILKVFIVTMAQEQLPSLHLSTTMQSSPLFQ